MRVLMGGVLLATLTVSTLGAQPLARQSLALPTTAPTLRIQQPNETGFFAAQVLAGMAGFGVGALGGAAVAAVFIDDKGPNGFEPLAQVLVGAVLGGVVGSSVVVYRLGESKGYHGSYLLTLAGSFVGVLGGPALFVTIPLGSTFGYNALRKPVATQ